MGERESAEKGTKRRGRVRKGKGKIKPFDSVGETPEKGAKRRGRVRKGKGKIKLFDSVGETPV